MNRVPATGFSEVEVADPFLLVDFKEAAISRFNQVSVVIRQSREGWKEF